MPRPGVSRVALVEEEVLVMQWPRKVFIMDIQLFADLEKAISNWLDDHCEQSLWQHLIHPGLAHQMAKAAKVVFDAAQDAQDYAEKEK